ncbi:MAG TPA: nuclear transport factor 2 family protein [Kofleriaceae bacterium]
MQKFRAAVEAMDPDAMVATLADDVVFTSPAVFKPYHGKPLVGGLLRCAMKVFSDFKYAAELTDGEQTALVFDAKVGELAVQGIDLGRVNEAGLVTHLTVFVRPMSGLGALAEAMQREIASAGIVRR